MQNQPPLPGPHNGRPVGADGVAVSPSLDQVAEAAQVPRPTVLVDWRTVRLCGLSAVLGLAAAGVALLLMQMIALVTNLAFFGRLSLTTASPADAVARLGLWTIVIPVIGGLLVGVMARYGSKAIRGHGIPEAMEQVLTNQSRIPARITLLKPLSSAVVIGTGGPFGAEGPIIATGGALGSVLGQFISTSAIERKTLLAAGAAAGMAATFGSPVSAVLLAIELLLFEYRPRSLIPVSLAVTVATGARIAFEGSAPAFAMPALAAPSMTALGFYVFLGAVMGLCAAAVTRAVYAVEDQFERLPIHWMWWPALGAVVVGIVGYLAPDTLGVGYYNITAILSNDLPLRAVAVLCTMKFISWAIALGSGTSGGTLAPLFTIGGGIGALMGGLATTVLPSFGVDLRMAALVGMATMFAGASRALLASAMFAFETTLQPTAILPLLGGCAAAYLVSSLAMRNTIMTEKIARRGVRTPVDLAADPLDRVLVGQIVVGPAVTLRSTQTVQEVQEWIATEQLGSTHQGFPVVDPNDVLVGVLTRRDLLRADALGLQVGDLITQLPRFVYDDCTVREATDHMVNHVIGRLPVVNRIGVPRVLGMVTRSDVLSCYRDRIADHETTAPDASESA